LPIKASGLLPLPYLSATCIMIQYTGQVVNTYFEKR
ncbi:MAG TPA: processing of HyaA and HyaB protein, partial [Mitsuokella multacida]|nr:processing of HyaA and HyaB protein [Mitsuokella multacida]